MVEEFANLIEDLGCPTWRIEYKRRRASRLWEQAAEELIRRVEVAPGVCQLRLMAA